MSCSKETLKELNYTFYKNWFSNPDKAPITFYRQMFFFIEKKLVVLLKKDIFLVNIIQTIV